MVFHRRCSLREGHAGAGARRRGCRDERRMRIGKKGPRSVDCGTFSTPQFPQGLFLNALVEGAEPRAASRTTRTGHAEISRLKRQDGYSTGIDAWRSVEKHPQDPEPRAETCIVECTSPRVVLRIRLKCF